MSKTRVVVCLLLLSSLGLAQTQTQDAQSLPPDAASRERVVKLFQMIDIEKTMEASVASIRPTLQKQLEQLDAERHLTAKQKREIVDLEDQLIAQVIDKEYFQQSIEMLIPIYQRHFTNADIDALLAFYSTPVGQKVLHDLPQLMADFMPKLMAQVQTRMQRAMSDLRFPERMKEILEEGQPNQQ